MKEVSSQNLVKVISENFHQIGQTVWLQNAVMDTQTHTHRDTQTGLIPDVNIFSNEMIEYKKRCS